MYGGVSEEDEVATADLIVDAGAFLSLREQGVKR